MKIKRVINRAKRVLPLGLIVINSIILPQYSLADNLQKYHPKKELGEMILDSEKSIGADQKDVETLQNLVDKATAKIQSKTQYSYDDATNILSSIDQTIRDEGFIYQEQQLLNPGLKTKKIDCDLYTTLYMCVAQKLNLPLKAVLTKNHAFIRWMNQDKSHLNWETTTGRETSDGQMDKWLEGYAQPSAFEKEYFGANERPKFEEMSLDKFVYWSVSLRNTEALIAEPDLDKRGPIKKRIMNTLIEYFNERIKQEPQNLELYELRGNAYFGASNSKAAIQDYSRVIEKNPNNIEVLERRATAHYFLGNREASGKDSESVKKIKRSRGIKVSDLPFSSSEREY